MVGHIHHSQTAVNCCCKHRAPQCCCHSNIPTACVNSIVLKKKKSPSTIKRDAARKKAFVEKKFPVISVTSNQPEDISLLNDEIKKCHKENEMLQKNLYGLQDSKKSLLQEITNLQEENSKLSVLNSSCDANLQEKIETIKQLTQQLNQQKNYLTTELAKKDGKIQSLSLEVSSLETELHEAKHRQAELDAKEKKLAELRKIEERDYQPLVSAIENFDHLVKRNNRALATTKGYFKLLGHWAKFLSDRPHMHCYHKSADVRVKKLIDRAFCPVYTRDGDRGIEEYFLAELSCNCPPKWFVGNKLNPYDCQEHINQRVAVKRIQGSYNCVMGPQCVKGLTQIP